jgi:signal peptidase I
VIHLLPSFTLDNRFSAQDLPDELQMLLLNDMAVPRIVSSSMMPTIQEGDRLKLSPPTSLTVGTIVVFRNDTSLICHRITDIDPQGTLSTKGDATAQAVCEVVQPSSVIGVVTGVVREGARVSLDQNPHMRSAAIHPSSLKSRVRTVVVRSATRSIRILAKLPVLQPMLAVLFRWTATVDVLTPAALQSLPSHSKAASFSLRMFPQMAGLLAASNGNKPTRYVVRLGPWRLAQYDPATESLLLRQSLREADLESFVRQCCRERQTVSG